MVGGQHGGGELGARRRLDTPGAEPEDEPVSDEDARSDLLDLAATAAGIGTFDWDLQTGVLSWDDRLIELFGYDADTFDRTIEGFNARLHSEDLARVTALLQHAIDTCGDYAAEYRIALPDGSLRWIDARGRALCDEAGTCVRLLGAAWDTTAGHRARRAAATSARRAGLIARVTSELTEHLDPAEAVARLSRLVVPTLADWCIVTLVDEQPASVTAATTAAATDAAASATDPGGQLTATPLRRLRDVASWHTDPRMRPLVKRYTATRLAAAAAGSYAEQALAANRPVPIPPDATESILTLMHPGEAADLIRRLAPHHGLLVPLRARGRTVGLLSLYSGVDRPLLGEIDVAVAIDVAGRAALALDNARLYAQQRDLAEHLQRSMLTAPPQPDHVQVVVRYVPAAETAQVGGDWYDAFLQPDGATVLVIGDVVGHDTQAAAAMGQIRTMLRSLGAEGADGPAAILRKVDRVMRTLQVDTLVTAVVARLEQTATELEQGITRLRWSNAGHPVPMVIHSDGSVTRLAASGVDLLLGVRPDTDRRETEVVLDRDAVVVLYTDGLVEQRGQALDEGLDRLEETLHELAGRSLDDLCEQLLTRLLPARPDDDVAIVAVRLHSQNAPRPPEAGPTRVPPDVPDAPRPAPLPDPSPDH